MKKKQKKSKCMKCGDYDREGILCDKCFNEIRKEIQRKDKMRNIPKRCFCKRCGKFPPGWFDVSHREWKETIEKTNYDRKCILCAKCFNEIRKENGLKDISKKIKKQLRIYFLSLFKRRALEKGSYAPDKLKKTNKENQDNLDDIDEWGNSIDGIVYNLDNYAEGSNESKGWIAKTLQKLPKEIRQKVLEDKVYFIIIDKKEETQGRCDFISIKEVINKKEFNKGKDKFGKYFTKANQVVIFLDFSRIKKGNEMNTIAHEIAHFILEHDFKKGGVKKNELIFKKQADNLTKKWGFKKVFQK